MIDCPKTVAIKFGRVDGIVKNKPALCACRWVAAHLLGTDNSVVERYRLLDGWENKWFPLLQTAIWRFIPADKREVFRDAFFKDLS